MAVASLAYGLALGARPNLLFGAVILLAPVIQTWSRSERERAADMREPMWKSAGPAVRPYLSRSQRLTVSRSPRLASR